MPRTVPEFDSITPPYALRDNDGKPVFVILSEGVQQNYDRNLERCERGWKATADPAFLIDALMWTSTHLQPLQPWLTRALMVVCANVRTKQQTASTYNAAIRYMRYRAVREAKRTGKTWDEAYNQDEWLAGTPAGGGSMKDAYGRVAGDFRNGLRRLYQFPRLPRRKN